MDKRANTNHHLLVKLTIAIVIGWISNVAIALESDSTKPIDITADSAEFLDGEKKVIYLGNVILKQGSMVLEADKVIIQEKISSKKGSSLYADGRPAKFKQKMAGKRGKYARGRANRIEYYSKSELIYLIGKASLTQDGNNIRSDRITYNRNESRIQGGKAAKGKQRVKFTVRPSDN